MTGCSRRRDRCRRVRACRPRCASRRRRPCADPIARSVSRRRIRRGRRRSPRHRSYSFRPPSNLQQQPRRVFQHVFYRHQKTYRVVAVDDAMIVRLGEIHHGPRDGKLTMEELTGGSFTITNGGVFGSLLSTPILNPPQSAILGMRKIAERAMVEDGVIVARPMMYLALSYDHRIIDCHDAVRFLVTIKDMLEDPARLLLQV